MSARTRVRGACTYWREVIRRSSGVHLTAGRRPKLDRPGGWDRGVRWPRQWAVLRAALAVCAHASPPRVAPFVTASVSGPAGPSAGGLAPPVCAAATLRDTNPEGVLPAPDHAREKGAGCGHRTEGRSGTPLPSGAAAGTRRSSGGRAVRSGQRRKRPGEGRARVILIWALFPVLRWRHAGHPLKPLNAESSHP